MVTRRIDTEKQDIVFHRCIERLAQAMDRMCASRARRLRMGENAQKRVKAYYRKEEMIEKYRKMYQEVEEADGRNRI